VPVTRAIELTLSQERKGAISIILITPAVAWNAPISRMGLVHQRGLGHESRCDVDGHVGEVVVCKQSGEHRDELVRAAESGDRDEHFSACGYDAQHGCEQVYFYACALRLRGLARRAANTRARPARSL
jgi:hypothetical protein